MRKTKIICTIGPASGDEKTLEGLMRAGMNVARFNFSHGTYDEHKARMDAVKNVRKKLGVPVAIMLDTKGPEYRIGMFENGKAQLTAGDTFTFTPEEILGTKERVSVSYKDLAKDLVPGDTVLVNNGLLSFTVREIRGGDVVTTVTTDGVISNRKSMSFPGKVLKQEFLSEKDKEDLLFGIAQDVDYVACSFVSTKEDICKIRDFLHENGGESISLIAKIENQSGVDNIESICGACDGIMIGRGDMGVEIPFEELPGIQKKLITKCRMLGKRVITATEMLESMIHNTRPTRAEISDVANAVYDGTSAVMLSGETAAGEHPVLTAETMAKIVLKTEENIHYKKRFYATEYEIRNNLDALSHSACALAIDLNAKAIAVCSMSGMTARMVSRFRPPVDILGVCVNEKNCRKLALSWGVIPVLAKEETDLNLLFSHAKDLARDRLSLRPGDNIIITGGTVTGKSGTTDTLRIETII